VSGADEARDAIRKALKAGYGPVWQAGKDYAAAYKDAIDKQDVVEAMAGAVQLVLAAEHLHDMAERAMKDARTELARQMDETGCHQIVTGNLTAYLQRKPAYVSIDDAAAIPPGLMHTPAPAPDKKAIKSAIEAGQDVPGASLMRPNEQTVAIRTKKD
jgi:Siphovirus Gp157